MGLTDGKRFAPIGARAPQHTAARNERKLWASVLETAWEESRSDYDGVWAWVVSGARYVGSFEWICEALGLDPDAVREVWPQGKPGTVHGARWRRG